MAGCFNVLIDLMVHMKRWSSIAILVNHVLYGKNMKKKQGNMKWKNNSTVLSVSTKTNITVDVEPHMTANGSTSEKIEWQQKRYPNKGKDAYHPLKYFSEESRTGRRNKQVLSDSSMLYQPGLKASRRSKMPY